MGCSAWYEERMKVAGCVLQGIDAVGSSNAAAEYTADVVVVVVVVVAPSVAGAGGDKALTQLV